LEKATKKIAFGQHGIIASKGENVVMESERKIRQDDAGLVEDHRDQLRGVSVTQQDNKRSQGCRTRPRVFAHSLLKRSHNSFHDRANNTGRAV